MARDGIVSETQRGLKEQGLVAILDSIAPCRRDPFFCLVNGAEMASGRNHFGHFRDCVNQGGLDVLMKRYGPQEEKKAHLLTGLVTMATARNV